MKIEHAQSADLPELVEYLTSAFRRGNPEHPRFDDLFPDIFIEGDDDMMGRHLIMRNEEGRIVACIGTYHKTMRIAGCVVPMSGLGQVSTDASMLGKGCMTQLLNASIARLENEGAALCWLGGRHDRYGRFGWEAVGASMRHYVSSASVRSEDASAYRVEKFDARESPITQEMMDMRAQADCSYDDTMGHYQLRMLRPDTIGVLARRESDGGLAAWSPFNAKSRSFLDQCGDIDAIRAMAVEMARQTGGVGINTPAVASPLHETLLPITDFLGTSPEQVLIVSLRRAVESFVPLLGKRLPKSFGLTLAMRKPDGSVEEASVGPGGARVELDCNTMARLLFGPDRATDLPGVPDYWQINALFPLPFYMPPFFHV